MRSVTHINDSWPTYEWVNRECHTFVTRHEVYMSRVTSWWVMSHTWMSNVTRVSESWRTYERVNESCHTCEWGVRDKIWSINESCYILMSHVTHANEECHTYKWVLTHIWMSEWGMSHMWMRRSWLDIKYTWVVLHLDESCHTCEQGMRDYEVATVSRMDKIIGLFYRIRSLL